MLWRMEQFSLMEAFMRAKMLEIEKIFYSVDRYEEG